MANTRQNLAEIGRKNLQSEEALVEAGKKTIRDAVTEALRKAGIQDAVGFDLKLVNGETISITSDKNPALDRPAAEISNDPGSVRIKTAARAGLTQVFAVIGR
jgi:hypothetical protein